MGNILCTFPGCDNEVVNGVHYCPQHDTVMRRAHEIEHQPAAEDIAADIARAAYGDDMQPTRRPDNDGRWRDE